MIPPLDQGQNSNNSNVQDTNQNNGLPLQGFPTQNDPNTQTTSQSTQKTVSDYLTQYNKHGIPIEVPAWADTSKLPEIEQTPNNLQVESPVLPEKQPVSEIYKAPETAPPIQKPTEQNPQPLTNTTINATPTQKTDAVVDKTKELTHLHPLTDTVDKLTTIADQEEADFIEKVEAAHGHN